MSGPTRRIDLPSWLTEAPVQRICAAIGGGRFVGGAVRDTLLGRPIGDLDLATPLEPQAVMARLAAAHIKAIPTGLAHGTITAVADGTVIEVTTLRRDVETDGRHAIVAFTDDWAEDAARRDFTMNALYLDAEGDVWDPVGGLDDCLAGRVRFVGDPNARIAEDFLRLLRFYRFQAHYGRGPADEAARAACRTGRPGLARLAGERIRVELLKLLSAPDPVPVLRLMVEDGILPALLGVEAAIDRLAAMLPFEPVPDPLRRLAALIPDGPADLAGRLKLSVKERDRLVALTAREPPLDPNADDRAQRRLLYRIGIEIFRDRVLIEASTAEPDRVPLLLTLAAAWPNPHLPVGGADALALGFESGRAVGEALRAVEEWWIAGDFTATRAACLERLAALAKPLA